LERYVTLLCGVSRANWDVTLPRLVLNQMSRERVVGRGGGGRIVVAFREDSKEAQSVWAQFGVGGGGRNQGASKRRRLRIWSDPVEGRGWDHSVKYGARRAQAKARSRTPGRPMSDMENRVNTPGMLRREKPRSVALSK